jgi:hypothetical protein
MPRTPRAVRLAPGLIENELDEAVPAEAEEDESRGRMRRAFSGTKELVRIGWRDPDHIPERLTLHAMQNLAEPSRDWAERARERRPDATPAELADDLRAQSVKIARLDGAIAGTPFFIALVPGYVSYLWQEARMGLRTAALFGRDPASLHTAAELLMLRGVHPTVEAAEEALRSVEAKPAHVAKRRPLRSWYQAVRMLLVFGGFLTAPDYDAPHAIVYWLKLALTGFIAFVIWVITWVFPLSFMLAMAWGCETHSRELGLSTLALYGGESATAKEAIEHAEKKLREGRSLKRTLRAIALGLSVGIPIAFVAYVNHVRQDTGINALGALGALVALSLVIAGAVYGSRR